MSRSDTGKNTHLGFITWMQMIGCFLVILGHSYPFVTEVPSWARSLQVFIYDFHMPLFVWCSGYLLVAARQAEKYAFGEYAKHRAVHILLPYLAFSLIGIVPKVLLSGFLNDSLSFDYIAIIRAFLVPRESIWGHFWFLPMIFFLGLIGYGLEYFAQKRTPPPKHSLCILPANWHNRLFCTFCYRLVCP